MADRYLRRDGYFVEDVLSGRFFRRDYAWAEWDGNHRFLCLRDDGSYVWKAIELEVSLLTLWWNEGVAVTSSDVALLQLVPFTLGTESVLAGTPAVSCDAALVDAVDLVVEDAKALGVTSEVWPHIEEEEDGGA